MYIYVYTGSFILTHGASCFLNGLCLGWHVISTCQMLDGLKETKSLGTIAQAIRAAAVVRRFV